ncbi:MAG: sulfite exporter TauE/SafE family protein [Methylophilaceae bacterium]
MDLYSQSILIIPLIFLAALLFSSVGHGGASGYLAVMAIMAIAPASMRPAALILNVFVASIALYKFYKAGAFSKKIFLPLVLASVPCAFFGGLLSLPTQIYKPIIGLLLLYAAWTLLRNANKNVTVVEPPNTPILLGLGGGLGLLSGLTGIGGGVLLSPILLFFRWAETKVVSGIAAGFILANSLAGLIGVLQKSPKLPVGLPYWVIAAVLGGLIGAEFGSKRLANPSIKRLLALVLVIAGIKLILDVLK